VWVRIPLGAFKGDKMSIKESHFEATKRNLLGAKKHVDELVKNVERMTIHGFKQYVQFAKAELNRAESRFEKHKQGKKPISEYLKIERRRQRELPCQLFSKLQDSGWEKVNYVKEDYESCKAEASKMINGQLGRSAMYQIVNSNNKVVWSYP
jgi:hypothetical protein